MTTRDAMEQFLDRCEETMGIARYHLTEGSKQGHYHDVEYAEAMQMLEDRYNELMKMYQYANSQQRERLHRMRLAIQSLQNEMTLLNHH